jgi:hypothetical protein
VTKEKEAPSTISGATMIFLRFFVFTALIVCPIMAHAVPLSPEEAASHVGENATVCGVVASATYAAQAMAAPTFLDLGKPYANQIFSAVILGSDRTKFGAPENKFASREKYFSSKGSQK